MFRVSKFNKSLNSSTPKVDFEVSFSSKADIVDLDFYDSDSSIEYLPSSLNILLTNATQEKDNFNHKSNLETELLPSVLNCSGYKTHAPIDSFGTTLDDSSVVETNGDDSSEESVEFNNNDSLTEREKKYKKPSRPCMFCQKIQTRLKRHILKKHKNEPLVIPILSMNKKEQDRELDVLQKKGIRNYNSVILKTENNEFMRERRNFNCTQDMPVMCSECKRFFSKKFKARHQLNCPATNINVMVPIVSLTSIIKVDEYPDDFKELLSTLILDEVGDCVKTDEIILMVGLRSFDSLKKKKDKFIEGCRTVRARMRLLARIYLLFKLYYKQQTSVKLVLEMNNAADMFRRETMDILSKSINKLCENPDTELKEFSISGQKSGLKISHFLVQNEDERSNRVVDFLKVFKLFENQIFGDAYYDLNYRKNKSLRKPINLPNDADVILLFEECKAIMLSIDLYEHPLSNYVKIRSATATYLIIFNARRGGEPVRLQIYQWTEAVNGEWVIEGDLPKDFDHSTMLITYQTGKGGNHLVPLIFPLETIKAIEYLTNKKVRLEGEIHKENEYIFASTQNSLGHASGWHCINDILKRLNLKGAINATKNKHRVASLLAKLHLSKKEQELIFQHFGHSERMNKDVYQAPPGSMNVIHIETCLYMQLPFKNSNRSCGDENIDQNLDECHAPAYNDSLCSTSEINKKG
nr:uncharacterized protein LOC124817088 [Hydra vulgaris]